MLSEIAEGNNTVLKSGVGLLSDMMSHWQSIGTVLLAVIGTYGVMKVSMVALDTIQGAYMMKTRGMTKLEIQNTIAVLTRAKAIQGLTAAQEKELVLATALNKVLRTNPYVAIGVAIAGVTAVLYSLYRESTRVSRELREIADSAAAMARATESGLSALVYKLRQAKEGTMGYADVIKEINRQYGDYLPNILSEAAGYDEVARAADAAKEAIVGKARAQAYDSGTQKIKDEYAKDVMSATTNLRNGISALLNVSEDEASVIAQKIRERLQSAIEDGIEISTSWIDKELKKVDERFDGAHQVIVSPTGSVTVVNDMEKRVRGVAKVYDDMRKRQAELDRDMNMSFGTEGEYDIEGVRKAKEDYRTERAKLAHDDLEREKELRKTMYEEMRKAYLAVNDFDKMRDAERHIEELSREKDEWVKLAEEVANASTVIGGVDYRVKKLSPDEKEQVDQIAYLDRVANAYQAIEDEIKKINHIPEASRTGDVNAQMAKLAFDKRQFDELAKILGIDYGDFGDKGGKEGKGAGKKGDDAAAELAERNAGLWKKALEAYRDYAVAVGKSDAVKRVREEGRFAGLDFDPERYRGALVAINAGLAGSTKERLKIKATIQEMISDFDVSKIRESTAEAVDAMERELSSKAAKWDLFDKFMSATGDREVSATFAFGGATEAKDYLADYAAELKKVAGETFKVQLDFDVESEETVRGQIGALYDGLPEELKKQVDKLDVIVRESNAKRLEGLADLLSKTASYDAQRAKVYRTYDDQILKNSGKTKEQLVRDRQAELSAIKADEVRNSKPFRALQGDLSYYSMDALMGYIGQAEKMLSEVTDLTEEEMKRQRDLIFKAYGEVAKKNPFVAMKKGYEGYRAAKKKDDKEGAEANWKVFESGLDGARSLVSELGSAAGGLASVFDDNVGRIIEGTAKSIGDLAGGIASLGKKDGGLGAKIQGVAGIISAATFIVGEAIGELEKQAANRAEQALIAARAHYSLILQMVSVRDELYENIFGTDTMDKMGVAQYGYENVTQELNEQRRAMKGAGFEHLWSANGLNLDAAKEYLEYESRLNDQERAMIEGAVELEEKRRELLDMMKEDLRDTFGGLSTGLMDGLIESIKGGTDAWGKFEDAGVAALERIGENLLYTLFMAEKFDKLQEALLATNSIEDPEERAKAQMDIVDAYYDDMEAGWDEMRNFGQHWKDEAERRGFEIWQPDEGDAKGLSASVAGITEDSAQLLGSYLNAIRGDMSVIREIYARMIEEMAPGLDNKLALIQADLMRIQENTRRNAEAAEEILGLIRSGMNGTKRFFVA
jgi:hypothetical protein